MWLAFPVMLSQVGQITVNIADNVMVGLVSDPKQSEINLGAVSLGNGVFFVALVLCLGISIIMSPLAAEKDAKMQYVEGASILTHGFVVNIIFGLLMCALIYFLAPLMIYMNQPEEVVKYAIPYLQISAFSILPLMIFQSFRQFGEGISLILPATIATWAANVINIFLNYCLINGNLGFPSWGVEGAAVASLVARIFLGGIIFVVLYRWEKFKLYFAHINMKFWDFQLFKKIVRLGLPVSFQMFFEVSAFTAAAFISGISGKVDLAAHQIAINLASISFLLCTGLAVATTVRVSNQKGLHNYKMLREVGYSNIIMTTVIMAISAITLTLYRYFFPSLFTDSQEVINLAAKLLIITALFQVGDGIQLVTMGALRGLQDVNKPMLITFIAYWLIAIPIGIFCALHTVEIPFTSIMLTGLGLGALGVWIGLGIALTFSAIILLYRYHRLSLNFIKQSSHEFT